MSLLSILSYGGQGLSAHRNASAVAGNNLANVNTEGYVRQRATLGARPAVLVNGGRIGGGVGSLGVTNARDRFLMGQVHTAVANHSSAATEATILEGVHAFDLDMPGALPGAMTDLFGALRDVANTPSDPSARQAAVAAAANLSNAFQRTASELQQARSMVDTQLRSQAAEVSTLSAQVAQLNADIASAVAGGQTPHELADQRALLAERLAGMTGARIVPSDDNTLTLSLPGGQALVSGDRAATMSVTPDATNDGHLSLRITPHGQSTLADVIDIGGELGGAIAARDGGLRQALTDLDALAFELGEEMNAIHAGGFGLDGTTGQALFDFGGQQQGAASNFSVEAAVQADPGLLAASSTAGGVPGDNENFLALIGVESNALPSGERPMDVLTSLITDLGATTSTARATASQEGALRTHLEDLRASKEGVSIDEEMIELQKSQRAFEAVSKVISTTDQMLSTLMDLR